MGNLTSRSLGTPPVDDGTVLSIPGRHLRASTAVTGQVDSLSFTFQGTTPKIMSVTSNALDHTVSYDNAGNEIGYYATRTYSPRNLMSTVADTSGEGPAHTISYGYDYRGVRVSRTESPTDAGIASRYYFYNPELQLLGSTVDDSNNVWGQSSHHILSTPLAMNREIIWFNGTPVAEIGPQRTPDDLTEYSRHRTFNTGTATDTFYTFTDHLGTPLIQTDTTGAVVWWAEYEPYGNVYLMRTGARTDQPLRFPGQELAMTWEGAEENYNVFRWYRAGWGRYSQADPIGATARSTLFSYAADDPQFGTDPLGLMTFTRIWGPAPPTPVFSQNDLNNLCNGASTKVSCTNFKSLRIDCSCHCNGSGGFAPAITAFLSIEMYIYQFTKAGMASDPTIHDFASAQAHEINKHILPALDGLKAWFESWVQDKPTEAECNSECQAVKNSKYLDKFRGAWNATASNH